MSSPTGSSQWMANAGGDFYNGGITASLRFPETSGGGYLSRTFDHNNPSNDWTFSTWIKRGELTGGQALFSSTSTGNPYYQSALLFNSTDYLYYRHASNRNSGGNLFNAVTSSNQFRDVSSWYHLVLQRDNDGNTIIYINGNQVASGSSSSTLRYINGTTYPHYIGNYTYQSNPGGDYHGYLAETIFVDGTLVAPTVLAETKNGVWIPKEDPDVTYGENGFRLQYKQTGTSANSSGIGADTSGNDHHFTVTTLAAHDVMPDNPENNFGTLMGDLSESSDYQSYATGTYSQGNLKVTGVSGWTNGKSNFLVNSGKWYAECRVNAWVNSQYVRLGVYARPARTYDEFFILGNGTGQIDAAARNVVSSFSLGDIIQIALDLENNAIYFGINNTWSNSATASEIAAGTTTNAFASGSQVPTGDGYDYGFYFNPHSTSTNITVNFGQDSSFGGLETAQGNTDGNGIGDFYYAPPSGFIALCSSNISEPTIGPNSGTQATDHHSSLAYTGDGSGTRAITGVGFKPDWVWFAQRNNTSAKVTYDSSRGVNQMLQTNDTTAEDDSSQYGYLSVFGNDGFTAQEGSTNNNYINENSINIVAWNWKANGGTTTTNDASATSVGTIDSVYQANTTAGFSIVLYTGTGSAGTIAHGLGAVPKWYFTKRRSNTGHWEVYHALNTTAPATEHLRLSTDDATGDDSQYFNDTDPTSTVFSVGDHVNVNASANTYVAYVFAEVKGFSKFGAYKGNGNSNGPFVFCGFKPAWVMIKRTDSANNWHINDIARDTTNPAELYTYADTTAAEDSLSGTGAGLDFLSNGFKTRVSTAAVINASGGTYVFMAFAEAPFKYANAR